MKMPAFGMFIFGLNVEFVHTLVFAQSMNLDVKEHHFFGLDALAVYNEIDYLMLLGWLYNPNKTYIVERIVF